MRKATSLALLLLMGIVFLNGCACCKTGQCPMAKSPALRHVVLLAWKDGTSADKIQEMEAGFAALPSKIDTIVAFEWGTNVSPEDLDQGFTHAFLVTFKDEAGRGVYLPHPAHLAFVELIKPHMEKALVLDYWTKK